MKYLCVDMDFSTEQYEKMLSGLFDRHPSIQQAGFSTGAYKPGLAGMQAFDSRLGHPCGEYPCIHVAGTNGKGSVSSMLAVSLAAGGRKVGLYTSPHLVDFRERMKIICGQECIMPGKEYVWDFLHRYDVEGLSFFEITTGMAFRWFADMGVGLAVVECGLGGRLDSTNIISPVLSIVTSIGLDHCELLGGTRALIAGEKAGIFKPGVPALVWGRDSETSPVFEERARALPCPLFYADSQERQEKGGFTLEAASRRELFGTDLRGPYQSANLRTVLSALEILRETPAREAISRSAQISRFRGRWERLLTEPETICDIGHNPQALEINFRRLEESGRPLFIVYGVMADKDIAHIVPLMPRSARYYLAAPAISRSLGVDALAARMEGLDARSYGSVADAVTAALRDAARCPGALVYVGGSNYLVSECILHIDAVVARAGLQR